MSVLDGQEKLREILEGVDWSVISFSTCQFCGEKIYHGPRPSTGKEDTTAKEPVWRHVLTQSAQCAVTYAIPVNE